MFFKFLAGTRFETARYQSSNKIELYVVSVLLRVTKIVDQMKLQKMTETKQEFLDVHVFQINLFKMCMRSKYSLSCQGKKTVTLDEELIDIKKKFTDANKGKNDR